MTAGIGLLPRGTFRAGGVSYGLQRIPVDLGARALWGGRLELGVEGGLAAALLRLDRAAVRSHRIELGLRVAALARWWITPRLGALLSLETRANLTRYQLVVEPDRVVGRTPGMWLAVLAGVTVRIN